MLYMATGKLAHRKLTIASVIIIFMNTITNYILSAKTTVFLHFRQRLSALSTSSPLISQILKEYFVSILRTQEWGLSCTERMNNMCQSNRCHISDKRF